MALQRQAARTAFEAELGEAANPSELASCFDRIDAAWPHLTCDAASFGRRLAQAARSSGAALTKLEAADLLLAEACLGGVPTALGVLDGLLADVAESLTRQTSETLADEATQRVRERMLLPTRGASPGLATYDGRGPLFGFLRVSALNAMRNLLSAERRSAEDSDDALAAMPDTADLEARLLRADQQAHFREAFRRAVKALSARQRALLRFSMIDGLSIDELAPMYQVHRSSLARWMAEAREALAEKTRSYLAEQLALAPEDVDSLIRSAQSQLDVSLSRVLRESHAAAPAP